MNLQLPHAPNPQGRWRPPPDEPALTFAPLAWLKLQFFLHAGDTEIGGFGISAEDDLLYIQDFVTVRQVTSSASVEFADAAVADYFDACVDDGLTPARFARIWLHTHPGSSPTPSSVDEATFDRVFGDCDWSLMFIIGRTGLTYARLALRCGPGGDILLPVAVDWAAWPQALTHELLKHPEVDWIAEYNRNIQPLVGWGMLDGQDQMQRQAGAEDREEDAMIEFWPLDDREWLDPLPDPDMALQCAGAKGVVL
jgi:hypothetical protein